MRSFYEVEVTVAGNNYVMVGVATAENRNQFETYLKPDTIYLYLAGSSGHYVNGAGSNAIRYLPASG